MCPPSPASDHARCCLSPPEPLSDCLSLAPIVKPLFLSRTSVFDFVHPARLRLHHRRSAPDNARRRSSLPKPASDCFSLQPIVKPLLYGGSGPPIARRSACTAAAPPPPAQQISYQVKYTC